MKILIGAFKFGVTAINGINDEDVRISQRLDLSTRRLRGLNQEKSDQKTEMISLEEITLLH